MAINRRSPHPARGARRAVGVASAAGLVALTTGMAVGAALAPSASGTLLLQQRPQPRTPVAIDDDEGYSGDQYHSGAVPSNTAAPQTNAQPVTVTRGS